MRSTIRKKSHGEIGKLVNELHTQLGKSVMQAGIAYVHQHVEMIAPVFGVDNENKSPDRLTNCFFSLFTCRFTAPQRAVGATNAAWATTGRSVA